MNYYAHSLKGQPPEKWHHLEDHLRNVAKLAADYTVTVGQPPAGVELIEML